MGVNILAGRPLDRRFKLGSANPLWVRFETEAPVDDLLVATSDGGFVAIQAKTTVSLSRDLRSGFGKTVAQFVRHWIACRDGDGREGWNRPLDSERDRLALIVGPQTSSTIKNDLPGALRHRAELGTTPLNEAQQRAVEAFDACVQVAWTSVTSEPFNPKLLSELAKLAIILAIDPEGADRQLAETVLGAVLPDQADPSVVLNILETISGDLMARRGGADQQVLRRAIASHGAKLAGPPRYQADIEALRRHSAAIGKSLSGRRSLRPSVVNRFRYRECQPVLLALRRSAVPCSCREPLRARAEC